MTRYAAPKGAVFQPPATSDSLQVPLWWRNEPLPEPLKSGADSLNLNSAPRSSPYLCVYRPRCLNLGAFASLREIFCAGWSP
jgi:hypothetical protein